MEKQHTVLSDSRGYAVVEATILFPIIMMIFAGLVLLAIYLPTRAVLQQATQYAATALATEQSDTWLEFDTDSMKLVRTTRPLNVYAAVLSAIFSRDLNSAAEEIVTALEEKSLVSRSGELKVECEVVNYVVYQEITVIATRTIPVPVDLSFVRFPEEIPITVSSSAVVLNGDEFVRNMDLAAEFMDYLMDRFGFDFSGFNSVMEKVYGVLGI